MFAFGGYVVIRCKDVAGTADVIVGFWQPIASAAMAGIEYYGDASPLACLATQAAYPFTKFVVA